MRSLLKSESIFVKFSLSVGVVLMGGRIICSRRVFRCRRIGSSGTDFHVCPPRNMAVRFLPGRDTDFVVGITGLKLRCTRNSKSYLANLNPGRDGGRLD